MKVSRYTHVFAYEDGLRLAYNTMTGSLLEIAGPDAREIERALRGDAEFPLRGRKAWTALHEQGFLVDHDVDELSVLREVHRLGKKKPGGVILTILPTLGCNFRCPYCFEQHTKGLMSPEVQQALLRFVETRLLVRGAQSLTVEWFGGEPLMGISVIESLTRELRALCEARGLPRPTASITTNGSLLTPKMARRLVDLGIESAQITLDGPPRVHDRRRPLVNGNGTFNLVLRNLKQVIGLIDVSLRINVDAGNKDSIFDLLQFLHREQVTPKARAYVAKVESFSDECASSQGVFLSSPGYAAFQGDLRARCLRAGIPFISSDSPRLVAYGFCLVDQPNGFVVQPDGKLLKCWAEAGNDTGQAVAHLTAPDTWDRLVPSILEARDPFDDEECCGCTVLPACMGGCPRIRQNNRQRAAKVCPPLRFSLADEVRGLYEGERTRPAAPAGARPGMSIERIPIVTAI